MNKRSSSACSFGTRLSKIYYQNPPQKRPQIPLQPSPYPSRIYRNPFKTAEFQVDEPVEAVQKILKIPENNYPIHVRTDEEKRKFDIMIKSKAEAQDRKQRILDGKKYGDYSACQRAKIHSKSSKKQIQEENLEIQIVEVKPPHSIIQQNMIHNHIHRPFANQFRETEIAKLTYKNKGIDQKRKNILNVQQQESEQICAVNMFLQRKREKQRNQSEDVKKAIKILRSGSRSLSRSGSNLKTSYVERCRSRTLEKSEFRYSMFQQ
eukprot:EST41991.1 Hypothetical protein SS50377_18296 [Spironucleus salmonicida]